MMNLFHRIFIIYQGWATKSPYITNCSMGFIIAGVGDLLCQRYFEHPSKLRNETSSSITSRSLRESELGPVPEAANTIAKFEWDQRRSLQMGAIRAVVVTPFVLFWYPFLTVLSPGSSLLRVAGRVTIDQMIGSPIVVTLVFFANSLLNNELSTVWTQLKERFFVTWTAGLRYWPFVHMFTFGIVPPAYQPLFAHFASVYWNAVLSYYSNMKTEDQNSQLRSSKYLELNDTKKIV